MQIRCTYCQTMFPISRDEMLAALQHMDQNKQVFYDAHCPKCRRANRVEKKKIEILIPNWKKAIKEMERDMSELVETKVTAKETEPVKKSDNRSKVTSKRTPVSKKAASVKSKTTSTKTVKAK